MSDKIYLQQAVVESSPALPAVTGVELTVNEDTVYSAGTADGSVIKCSCPWGTQAIADRLLRQYQGTRYRPITATQALMNPAAEIGDGISVARNYGGLYWQDLTFGRTHLAFFSAPGEKSINHEFQFQSPRDRYLQRTNRRTQATLTAHAGLISAEVKERKEAINSETDAREKAITELSGRLDVQAGLISAKVSQTGGTEDGSFSWSMIPTEFKISANKSPVLTINKNKSLFSGDIEAENGYFHGKIYAGQIESGDKAGTLGGKAITPSTLPGSSLQDWTVGGGKIQQRTITGGEWGNLGLETVGTLNTQEAINLSLANADTANSVLFGSTHCSNLVANGTLSGSLVNASNTFQFKGKTCKWTTIQGIPVITHI